MLQMKRVLNLYGPNYIVQLKCRKGNKILMNYFSFIIPDCTNVNASNFHRNKREIFLL